MRMRVLCQQMTSIGIQRLEGDVVGTITVIVDHERDNYSESVENKDDWCNAESVSTRDCKASHKGG